MTAWWRALTEAEAIGRFLISFTARRPHNQIGPDEPDGPTSGTSANIMSTCVKLLICGCEMPTPTQTWLS